MVGWRLGPLTHLPLLHRLAMVLLEAGGRRGPLTRPPLLHRLVVEVVAVRSLLLALLEALRLLQLLRMQLDDLINR